MADLIQFQCPVCGTTLRLPLEMAALQGPCPCCGREIVAPDPYRGLGAYEPAAPLVLKAEEPFKSFAESPPLIRKSPASTLPAAAMDPMLPADPTPPQPDPVIHPAAPETQLLVPASPQRAIFVLSILLTAAVCLVAGYLLGASSQWSVALAPPRTTGTFPPEEFAGPPPIEPVMTNPEIPDPVAEPQPEPQPEPEPEKKPEAVKASAAAEAALRAFLDAPDWTTRNVHSLHSEKVRPAMEAYSQQVPDGPTAFRSVSIQNSYTDKKTGNTLFIFQVTTDAHPTGIPVAVAETASGWQVDWQSFVEFRDDRFKAFADGPADQTGRFHLIVSTPPAPRAAKTDNEHFSSFLLDPPLPNRQRIAYAKKSSEVHAALSAATALGAVVTPVVEVAKRTTPEGKGYLEIVGIPANDWLPEE